MKLPNGSLLCGNKKKGVFFVSKTWDNRFSFSVSDSSSSYFDIESIIIGRVTLVDMCCEVIKCYRSLYDFESLRGVMPSELYQMIS